MKLILQNLKNLYEINKSKFYGFIYYVETREEVNKLLASLRGEYSDATHVCYAYVLNKSQSVQKYFDDGEPSGTAGYPLLSLLLKNELTNILVVVVRYFGGIKLGAAGLLRAYTKTINNLLQEVNLIDYKEFIFYQIQFDYSSLKVVDNYLNKNNVTIVSKTFDEIITYEIKSDVTLTPLRCFLSFQKI